MHLENLGGGYYYHHSDQRPREGALVYQDVGGDFQILEAATSRADALKKARVWKKQE